MNSLMKASGSKPPPVVPMDNKQRAGTAPDPKPVVRDTKPAAKASKGTLGGAVAYLNKC